MKHLIGNDIYIKIANTLGMTSIIGRSDTFASGRYINDFDLRDFAIRDVTCKAWRTHMTTKTNSWNFLKITFGGMLIDPQVT